MNICPNCGTSVDETAKFCSECGSALVAGAAPLRMERAKTSPVHVAKDTTVEADREETVALAAELTHLQYWGFSNVATEIGSFVFPGLGILVGLAMFCLNPVWWVVGPIFSLIGLARLEKGDPDGARRALRWGRCINWAIVLVVVLWGFLALRSKAGQ